jgi:hypothetical protein
MSTKHYAILNPNTGLYSVGYTHSHQSWDILDVARIWDRVGDVKAHITHCNKLARHAKRSNPYIPPMQIVEVEKQVTDKGLVEKI